MEMLLIDISFLAPFKSRAHKLLLTLLNLAHLLLVSPLPDVLRSLALPLLLLLVHHLLPLLPLLGVLLLPLFILLHALLDQLRVIVHLLASSPPSCQIPRQLGRLLRILLRLLHPLSLLKSLLLVLDPSLLPSPRFLRIDPHIAIDDIRCLGILLLLGLLPILTLPILSAAAAAAILALPLLPHILPLLPFLALLPLGLVQELRPGAPVAAELGDAAVEPLAQLLVGHRPVLGHHGRRRELHTLLIPFVLLPLFDLIVVVIVVVVASIFPGGGGGIVGVLVGEGFLEEVEGGGGRGGGIEAGAAGGLDVGAGLRLHGGLGGLGEALVPRAVLVGGGEVEARGDELHEGVEEEGVAVGAAAAGGRREEVGGGLGARGEGAVVDGGGGRGLPAHRGEGLEAEMESLGLGGNPRMVASPFLLCLYSGWATAHDVHKLGYALGLQPASCYRLTGL